MTETTVTLGPSGTDGYEITVVRGFEDGTEEYTTNFVKYRCRGVVDVDVNDPWQVGGKVCTVSVTFATGESVFLHGVIDDIDTTNNNTNTA